MGVKRHIREREATGETGDHFVANHQRPQQLANGASLGLRLCPQRGQNTQSAMARRLAISLVELTPVCRRAVGDGGGVAVCARPGAAKDRCLGRGTSAQELFLEQPDFGLAAGGDDGRKVIGDNQGSALANRLRQVIEFHAGGPLAELLYTIGRGAFNSTLILVFNRHVRSHAR